MMACYYHRIESVKVALKGCALIELARHHLLLAAVFHSGFSSRGGVGSGKGRMTLRIATKPECAILL